MLEHDKTGVELQGAVTIERREEDPTCLELDQNASDGIFWWQLRAEWHCHCAGTDLNDR